MYDINAALTRLRDLTADVASGAASLNDVADLGVAFADLDEHLARGGTFPTAWSWDAAA